MTVSLRDLSHSLAATHGDSLVESFRQTDKLLRHFAHMQRVENHGDPRTVALFHPKGSGNKARRRLGQRAVFRTDADWSHGPECESDATHLLVWIDRAGMPARCLFGKALRKRVRLPK